MRAQMWSEFGLYEKGEAKKQERREMTDDDMTDEELAFALRELERLGLVESRMGDDGRVYYRRTGKELTDEISDYEPGRSQ
jgi:DNA-binding transcriptional ArsR family regulator